MGKPAPKGNKYALGNSGGGRLSIKEEKEHKKKWMEDHEVAELEKKIASKKYSPWDVYRLKALKGDAFILKNWADKVLANLNDSRFVDGEGNDREIGVSIYGGQSIPGHGGDAKDIRPQKAD